MTEVKKKRKKKQTEHLVLIDGTNMLYRAHHALERNGLTCPEGNPTGAIYGTMNMLKAILQWKPTHVAFVMDAKNASAYRRGIFPEYKAGRPEQPKEIRGQTRHIRRLARAMGLTVVRQEGQEADDLIGTLAMKAKKRGWFVTIHSGDKDFCQLVGTRITVYNANKRRQYNTKVVRNEYGINPKQFVDYLALMGDKVDNIPGVDGVGPATARDLLQRYGDLTSVLGAARTIGGALGERLRAQRIAALMSHKLATIRCGLKCVPELDELVRKEPNEARLKKLKKEWGFRDGTGQGMKKKKHKKEVVKPKKTLF